MGKGTGRPGRSGRENFLSVLSDLPVRCLAMLNPHRWIPLACLTLTAAGFGADPARTVVTMEGEKFLLNGKPTYAGRTWDGVAIEGRLMNSRMVQGVFD